MRSKSMQYINAISPASGMAGNSTPVPPAKDGRSNTGGGGVGSRPGPSESILVPTHKIFCKGGASHGCR